MVTPYFSSIRKILVNALCQANASIDIAVAWFTNEEIFDAILSKLDNGVNVRIVLINDDINHCSGLDFQVFIDKGGKLFFGRTGYFMHNKYCIIDGKTVYTGSYNYTYFAEHSNFENIVCISEEESAVSEYVKNYEHILSVSDEVRDIESFLKEHPYAINTHASRQLLNRDQYQKANELYNSKDTFRAEQVIRSLTPSVDDMKSFVIRDVLYKQWQPCYCIRKITVTDSSVKMDIEVEVDTPSFFIYGPGLNKTWHISTSSQIVSASAIADVKLDGTNLLDKLEACTAYRFCEADTKSFYTVSDWGKTTEGMPSIKESHIKPKGTKVLSCTITFPKGDYINEIVDVYEGHENDTENTAYWHFLRVNMLLNREAL